MTAADSVNAENTSNNANNTAMLANIRNIAIIQKVWFLTEEERKLLDLHFVCKTDSSEFLRNLQTDEKRYFKDYIIINNVRYYIETMHCSIDSMDDMFEKTQKALPLLVSVRSMKHNNINIALVQPRYSNMTDEKWNSISNLEFGKV